MECLGIVSIVSIFPSPTSVGWWRGGAEPMGVKNQWHGDANASQLPAEPTVHDHESSCLFQHTHSRPLEHRTFSWRYSSETTPLQNQHTSTPNPPQAKDRTASNTARSRPTARHWAPLAPEVISSPRRKSWGRRKGSGFYMKDRW